MSKSTRDAATPGRTLLIEVPPPSSTVAQGFARGGDLLGHVSSADYHTSPVELGVHADKARIERWAASSSIVEARPSGTILTIEGPCFTTSEETLLLDSREERVEVAFEREDRRYVLALEHGFVQLFELRPRAADFPEVKLPPPLLVAPFELEELIGRDEQCEPWLEAHVRALLAAGDALGTAAAAGALLRLWSPPTPAGRARMSALLREGGEDVLDRLRAWAAATERWEGVETAAVLRAQALHERLERLEEAMAGGHPELVERTVRERDELESIAAVLIAIGGGGDLRAALDALDREAEAHFSALGTWSEAAGDPHLDAVSWREPESWWGRLVE